jgi:Tfp pilus assembly protein PilO
MLRNFKPRGSLRDAKLVVRVILGVLLAANLIAAALVLFPIGGSAEELEQQFASLQSQVKARQAMIERTRQNVAAVQTGGAEGNQFLGEYFLAKRTAFSTLVSELVGAAGESKFTAREHSFQYEPIEGSDTLTMMSITGAYEGTYSALMHFVHEIDKSKRLLIVESLNAAPQTGTGVLAVQMKLDTFVREDGTQGQ